MNEEDILMGDQQHELAYRVAYLLARFIQGNLTEHEHLELDDWIALSMDNQRLFEQLTDPGNVDQWMQWKETLPTEARLERLKDRLVFTNKPKRSVVRSNWNYVAAACVLAFVVMGFFLVRKGFENKKDPVMVTTKTIDIAPGSAKAILTLSDGSRLPLSTINNGRLPAQGNTILTKPDNGQLVYQADHTKVFSHVDLYNTLTVPAGGQYQVVLPDGTRVWLNALSSLRYPTAFTGSTRKVELTGEGYFEVSKDLMFPFEVIAGAATVRVLGTHFNINAYKDETSVDVGLAEGSVRLNNEVVLAPGEGGSVAVNGNVKKTKIDVEKTMAWKDGKFIFRETSLADIMRQTARWYNAEIIYHDDVSAHFTAQVERSVSVSKLLHLLETTGQVHFTIAQNKIIVMK